MKKKIGFALYPERGGYYPTFRIARALKEMGHDVVYFGTHEFENEVKAQGFKFEVLFRDVFRENAFDSNPLSEKMGFFGKWKEERSYLVHEFSVVLDAVVNGKIADIIRRSGVDIMLVDALLDTVALAAAVAKIDVCLIATELIGVSASAPPTSSGIIPDHSFLTRIRITLCWFKIKVACNLVYPFATIVSLLTGIPRLPRRLIRGYNQMKKKSGLAFVQDEYGTHPRLPELVLCPPEFEFKTGHTMAKRFYIGHCIDISRKEPAFPWDRLKENANTLIYCSLGTHVALYRTAYRFFNALMKTAAMRPEYVFVVSVGPGRNNGDFGSLPDNVIVAQRVPQLAILQKTSVMLTNGGLGTVKECIYHAVPMLVYPCGWDQPGNAARVRYHRIGICDTIKKVTYRRMSDKIDELINSSEIRENIQRMSRLIRKNEKLHEGLRFILDHGKKLNACSRSEIRTSTGSMPTENLTVFS